MDFPRALEGVREGEDAEGGEGGVEMVGGEVEGLAVHFFGFDVDVRGEGKIGEEGFVGGNESG